MTTLPSIHINGTSARNLLEDYCKACDAIRNALEALAQCGPNGRDYYPQGDHALRQAILEHNARADRLRDTLGELEKIAEYVSDHA